MNIKNIIIGLIIVKLSTFLLKRIVDQHRPNGKKYGMPSFTGAYTGFFVTYLLKTKFNLEYIVLSSLFIIINFTLKHNLKQHNLKQLVSGFILGSFISLIF